MSTRPRKPLIAPQHVARTTTGRSSPNDGANVDWLTLITDGVRAATRSSVADSVSHALVILEHLQREHGGLSVYVPVLKRDTVTSSHVDRIRENAGVCLDRACWRAGISRRTYYRLKRRAAREVLSQKTCIAEQME